jgi:flagellar assembly protein FliH
MSKVISKSELEAYSAWQPPHMSGTAGNTRGVSLVTAKQIERIQRQAYEEGLALGRHEAFDASRAQLESVLTALADPLRELDAVLTDELVALVTVCARQLIRRELKSEPGEIVAVVREAMTALTTTSRQVSVHLHPDDAALVREVLGEGEQNWKLIDDPTQTRGGCRVTSDVSQIDASVEARLAAVVARMLGGDREHD